MASTKEKYIIAPWALTTYPQGSGGMTTKNFLAVDLGAESGRTIVGRFDGRGLTLEETHRFSNGSVRVLDTLYWDILRLWQEIKNGIARSAQSAGSVASLGVDTWGVDFGLVGPDGALIGNPIHYRDARTNGIMEYAFEIVPKAEIYAPTGLQFMQFNSLFQLLSIARNGQLDPYGNVQSLLFIPDLFSYFLTGHKVAEYTIASTSQMLDARSQNWATDLLARFRIPDRILPPIVSTGTVIGEVLASVGSETGIAGAKVIASAGHDTAAAVAAVPSLGADWCYISSGTWSLMGAEIPEPAINEKTLADNFTNEGGIGGSIRLLKNIMGLWLVQQCRRSFEKSGQSFDYSTLARLAEEATSFGPIVDPDDPGFHNPLDMPTAIREFCRKTSQAIPSSEGAIIRCCLESLALRYRKTLEQLETILGRTLRIIHIVGGGCQNELLCQLTADACQRTVIAGPVEATAMGNCLVQAMAAGDIGSLADIREVVRNSFPTRRYEARKAPQWDEQFAKFQSLRR